MLHSIERFLGKLFRNAHAGEHRLACNDPKLSATCGTMLLKSEAFADGTKIPDKYAGQSDGRDVSPPLAWSGIPDAAKQLVLIVQDPDAPLPSPVVHLIVVGIPPTLSRFNAGELAPEVRGDIGFGKGWLGKTGYVGPRPVLGHGPHRYMFQLFALSKPLSFSSPPPLDEVVGKMSGSVLACACLSGVYERK